jgi:DNA-binding PadR family transcriptional regulator
MTVRRSPLALVLLVLLAEAPMHPYRMRELMKERGKDKVANVAQRNSVYQTIDRLEREGLIRVLETVRSGRPSVRTVYELTPEGATTATNWLREMLSTPAAEFPDMPAALASMLILGPDDVATCLSTRLGLVRAEIAAIEAEMAPLPRIFVLEDEYVLALRRAEVTWLQSVVDDLRSGALWWDLSMVQGFADLAGSDGAP